MMKMRELTIQMIDFRQIYDDLTNQAFGNQKKININSCLNVFFGYNFDGNLRLSFMSETTPPAIKSTKILNVVQGRENTNIYWTSFDLLNADLKDAYLSFCENMIESVVDIKDEQTALSLLKKRFATWRALFKKSEGHDLPKEEILGLFGELTVLKEIIAEKYGINTAVKSWGGPDMHSKDFTLDTTWYEVKTVGANADKVIISSLVQLSSEYPGHLVIVKAESVSPEFTGSNSSLIEIINDIIVMISDDDTEALFTRKIKNLGIDIMQNNISDKFDVKSIKSYKIDGDFPRITEKNVNYSEITDVTYAISIAAISRFEENDNGHT